MTDPEELLASCAGSPAPPCVQQKLEAVLMAHGSEPAFRILDNLTALDSSIAGAAHDIAHHLGRASVSHYPSAAQALQHCPVTMASGCFHGVLERHFTDVGAPRQASDLTQLCTPADGQNRFFQCLHGLGHGLMMVAKHDVPQALAWCILLEGNWTQHSCAGGVFMENVVGDTSMQHHHGDAAHHHSTWLRMKAEDPHYPCNAVAERWLHACYWMQSSLMLKLGMSIPQIFEACNAAPKGHNRTCYESMGRDIAGMALWDASSILDLCQAGQATLQGRCIYGAVQAVVNNDGDPDPGFAFCKKVPVRQKEECYTGVGHMLRTLTPAPTEAQRHCIKSEQSYRNACLDAALG